MNLKDQFLAKVASLAQAWDDELTNNPARRSQSIGAKGE